MADAEYTWDDPVIIFSESSEIKEIALTFDQLGRPLVFYRIGTDQLYLYWFNALTSQNESKFIGVGHSPVAGFDIINDTSDPTSDAMIFYVRNNTAYMRIQREDYNVEYDSGVTLPDLKLNSSGMRVDGRFQVVYTYSGPNQGVTSPEDPEGTDPGSDPDPGIDPEDPGLPENQTPADMDYVYKNTGWATGSVLVANTVKINGNDTFNLGFEIVENGLGYNIGGLTTYYVFGADTFDGFARNLQCLAYIDHARNNVMFMVWRSTSGVNYHLPVKDMNTLKGVWEFEFTGSRIKLYLNGVLKAEDNNTAGSFSETGRLTFGGIRHVLRRDSNQPGNIFGSAMSFDGVVRDCWIDHPNYGKVEWPVTTYNTEIQPSDPVSEHTLFIVNHKSSNWIPE